jgi:uncharacterized surface protein with fasciclin (FAS1) repeats
MSALVGRALEDQYGSINKDKTLATQVLEAVNREVFVQQIYPELTDALFRTIDSLEKGKTLHNLLSEEESFTELYEFFAYGLEREKNRGRNIITL